MDFKGQKLAEILYTIIIALFGLVGFVWGYQEQDFTYCFRCWFVGVALASILTIPDWGMFNKNSPKWLDEVPAVWSTRETTEENEEKEETQCKRHHGHHRLLHPRLCCPHQVEQPTTYP